MNGISHKQTVLWIHRRLDELLNESELVALAEHLRSCEFCRTYAAQLDSLPAALQNKFHARWDKQPGPAENVMYHVTTRARGISMTNRTSAGLRLTGGVATLIALAFLINFVISQLRDASSAGVDTEVTTSPQPVESRLLAFTSNDNGNADIYTIHADGSGLTNLTNNPADDVNPIWSPDGKRIAFESNRENLMRIYLMDADGSNLIQFTNDTADHGYGYMLPINIDGNPWSPDGSQLLFLQSALGGETESLYVKGINAENKVWLASGDFSINNISWSPNGDHIAYILNDSPTPNETFVPGIYIVDPDGSNRREVTKSLQANERLDGFSYDWSADGQSIFFIAYKHSSEGNDQWIAYEASIDGDALVERATSSTPMDSWSDGTSFIRGFDSSVLTWLRSDGTYSTLKPFENCQMTNDSYYGFLARRSFSGDLMIGVDCPNRDLWFFWANSNGTFIKQLFDSPISVKDGGLNDIVWSPDNKYIAINVYSVDVTYTYIVNVEEALKDPSALPNPAGQVAIGYSISWQPTP